MIIKNKNIIKIILGIIVGMYLSLYSPIFSSGIYEVTGSNINSLGLDIQDDSGTLTADSTGFYVTNRSLIIGKFTIQDGQSWNNVTIDFLSGGGNVDIFIRDASGSLLYNAMNQNTTLNVDISNLQSAIDGKALAFVFAFHGSIKITSLKISYTGQGVIGYPSPFLVAKDTFNIAYDLPNDAIVTLQIYDRRGRLVKNILNDTLVSAKGSPKQNTSQWDGKNENGVSVSAGIYIIFLNVKFSNYNNWDQDVQDYTSTFKFLVYQ